MSTNQLQNSISSYVKKVAESYLSNVQDQVAKLGTIISSYNNYYEVKLIESDSLVKAFSIGGDSYNYKYGDSVYLIRGSQTTETELSYWILGLSNLLEEDAINATAKELFYANATKNLDFSDNDQEIFINDSVFIGFLKTEGYFKVLANWSCNEVNISNDADYGLEIKTYAGETVLESFWFGTHDFDGQPFKISDRQQSKVFHLTNTTGLDSVKISFKTVNLQENATVQVSQLMLEAGTLQMLDGILEARVEAEDGKDYYLASNSNAAANDDSVTLAAAAWFNNKHIYSDEIKYYWFILEQEENDFTLDDDEEKIVRTSYNMPKEPEQGAWYCINDYDLVQTVSGNSIPIWKNRFSPTLEITNQMKEKFFSKFDNQLKCVIFYAGYKSESEVLHIYDYQKEDFKIEVSTNRTPVALINQNDAITLTCNVKRDNTLSKIIKYKFTWQKNVGTSEDSWEDLEEVFNSKDYTAESSSSLVIKDCGKEAGENDKNKYYELGEEESVINFRCVVYIDHDGNESVEEHKKNSNSIQVESWVSREEELEIITYYKYFINESRFITFEMADLADQNQYVNYHLTNDKIKDSSKIYFSKDEAGNYEEAEEDAAVSSLYEKFQCNVDWVGVEWTYSIIEPDDWPTEAGESIHYYKKDDNNNYIYVDTYAAGEAIPSGEYYSRVTQPNSISWQAEVNNFADIPKPIEDSSYLYYTQQEITFKKSEDIYTAIRVLDWTQPTMLYGRENGSEVAASIIDKYNVFNQLTQGGSAQGLYPAENGDVYINATFIKTGHLEVSDAEGNTTFKADIDSKEVEMAGFTVDKNAIYKKDKTAYLGTDENDNVKFKAIKTDNEGNMTSGISFENGSLIIKGTIISTGDSSNVATKDDLNDYVTEGDLENLVTKQLIIVYSEQESQPTEIPYWKSDSDTNIGNSKLWKTEKTVNSKWMCQKVDDSFADNENAPWSAIVQIHGLDAPTLQIIYKLSEDTPLTPTGESPEGWKWTEPTLVEGQRVYMSQKFSNETNWSDPIPFSAKDGTEPEIEIVDGYWYINGETTDVKAEGQDGTTPKVEIKDGIWYINDSPTGINATGPAGKDGSNIEYIYYLSATTEEFPGWTGENIDPKDNTDQTDPVPGVWYKSPQGISELYKYEYVSIRTKASGTNTSWSSYSNPVIWSKWGEKGQDGDGVEYQYTRTKKLVTTWTDEYDWTDEPKGVDSINKYEYVKQGKVTTNESGIKTTSWSTPALWSKWSDDGKAINTVEEWYLASASSSGVTIQTSGWNQDISTQQISNSKPYLWNYEVTYFEDGVEASKTDPVIIAYYTEDGNDGWSIDTITNYYAVNNSLTAPGYGDTRYSATNPDPDIWKVVPGSTTENAKYLWNYEVITYTGGQGTKNSTVTQRAIVGTHGSAGRGITEIQEQYGVSTAETESPTVWKNSPSAAGYSSTNKYLWNKEIITYSDSDTPEESDPVLIAVWGEKGEGIEGFFEYYILTTGATPETLPTLDNDNDWYKFVSGGEIPIVDETNTHLWNCEIVKYTNGSSETFGPALLGTHGSAGKSIDTVEEWYAINNVQSSYPNLSTQNATGVLGWTKTLVSPTKQYPYLWNYEVTYFEDDNIASQTDPVIIAYYTEDGRGIKSITNYYKVTASSVIPARWNGDAGTQTQGVESSEDKNNAITDLSWSTSTANLSTTNDKPLLWNFECIEYTKADSEGNTYYYSPIQCVGTHGDKGDKGDSVQGDRGVGITNQEEYYTATGGKSPTSLPLTNNSTINTSYWKTKKEFFENWNINGSDILNSKTNPIVWKTTISTYDTDPVTYTSTTPIQIPQLEAVQNAAAAQNTDKGEYATPAGKWCADNNMYILDGSTLIAGTVEADKIKVNELSAISASMGTITAGEIQSSDKNISVWEDRELKFKSRVPVLNPGLYDEQWLLVASWQTLKDVYYFDCTQAYISAADAQKEGTPYAILRNEALSKGKKLILSTDVNVIGQWAFYLSPLTHIYLPDTVTQIQSYAFRASQLKEIILPSTITTIQNYPFYQCYDLTIYSETTSKLDGWSATWNGSGCPVYYYSESTTSASNKWKYTSSFKLSCYDDNIIDSHHFKVSQGGEIVATSGFIGGWRLSSSLLSTGNKAVGISSDATYQYKISDSSSIALRFWAGGVPETNSIQDNLPFFVTANGLLKATNAEIQGKITATELYIGDNNQTLDNAISANTDVSQSKEITTGFSVNNNYIKMQAKQLFVTGKDLIINTDTLKLNHNGIQEEDGYFSINTNNFQVTGTGIAYMKKVQFNTQNGTKLGEVDDNGLILYYNDNPYTRYGKLNCILGPGGFAAKRLIESVNASAALSNNFAAQGIDLLWGCNNPEMHFKHIYTSNYGIYFCTYNNNPFYSNDNSNLGEKVTFYCERLNPADHILKIGGHSTEDTIQFTSKVQFTGNVLNSGGGTQFTSDYNLKNSITAQPFQYSLLFYKLKPVSFKYNNGSSNRIHMGLIAQDVENAINELNIDSQDFAPLCYELDENNNKYNYSIRYTELVSMCIYEIQQNRIRIEQLEQQLNKEIKGDN